MLEIRLLGPPGIWRDGESVRPRGRKAWGLLAYLILSEVRNPSRERLADLLFAEADDPLRSLRWNLSELRSVVGRDVLPPGRSSFLMPADGLLDVDVLRRGTPEEALKLPGLGSPLLGGLDFSSAPGFDGWLSQESRHLLGIAASAIHEAALDRLAAGRPAEAVPLTRRLVELEPLDENFQELTIRCMARCGDSQGAQSQLRSCSDLFRSELGRDPAPSVVEAANETEEETTGSSAAEHSPGRRESARVLLEAGEAAAAAGATDTALQSLRRAVQAAGDSGQPSIEAASLLALGTALVHAVRGRDEEAAALLRRAAGIARSEALADVEAGAIREIGYIDMLVGRYVNSERALAEAAAISDSPGELAAIESIRAEVLGDRGAHRAAVEAAAHAVELSNAAGEPKRAAYALTAAGRSKFLMSDLPGARESLQQALDLVASIGWISFEAWPEGWLAEVELADGNVDLARDRFEHAFALGCELRDPCWEGLSGRGLGMIAAREGRTAEALRRLEDARGRATRTTDCYLWIAAYTLEGFASVAVASGSRRAPALVEDLRALAGRSGMYEFSVRAFALKEQLGDPGAAAAARLLSAEIESLEPA